MNEKTDQQAAEDSRDTEKRDQQSEQEAAEEQAGSGVTEDSAAAAEAAEAAESADGDASRGGDPQQSGESEEDDTVQRLAEAEQALSDQHEEMLRLRAEMQNLQRRTEQDVEKARKFGQERFATELLGVIDNLERALEAVPDREDEPVKALYEGVELTLKSFQDTLAKFNIEPIDPEGEPFDPRLHEAMTMQENADVEPDTVVAVMQKGYTLHGRVIRPARVVVARAPSDGVDEKA